MTTGTRPWPGKADSICDTPPPEPLPNIGSLDYKSADASTRGSDWRSRPRMLSSLRLSSPLIVYLLKRPLPATLQSSPLGPRTAAPASPFLYWFQLSYISIFSSPLLHTPPATKHLHPPVMTDQTYIEHVSSHQDEQDVKISSPVTSAYTQLPYTSTTVRPIPRLSVLRVQLVRG